MTTAPHAASTLAASAQPIFDAVTAGVAGRAGLVLVLLATASAAWWIARRRAARFRPTRAVRGADGTPGSARSDATLTGTELGTELGSRATFVQFSAQTCASCPQVRRVLTSLAESEPGVVHLELDAEAHMDLVRRFSVFRTPTVLLLDADGAVRARTSGPLTLDRAQAALAPLPAPALRSTHV